MTRDIDLVVALAARDVDTIVRLFHPDYYVSREAVSDSIANESLFNLIHQESVIKVDCIVRKASPYRLAEFERRQRLTIEDFSTWIASKEDLIISKLFWANDSHSEMQLRDVRNLASTGLRRGLCRALDAEARTRYPLERMQSVTDTPPEIAEMVRARLMALSSPERFLMGIRMCDAARRMVLASLPADLPEPERKRLLFERFYREPMPEQGAEVYAKA